MSVEPKQNSDRYNMINMLGKKNKLVVKTATILKHF